jgi:hypothetical protein
VIVLPVAVGEKEFQPHDERSALSLLTVDHAGNAAKTPLKGPHVDALVGRPPLPRQDTGAVKAHLTRGRDLVGKEVHAHQRYAHFQWCAIFGPASRARIHVPSHAAKTCGARGTGGNDTWRLCRSRTATSIRQLPDCGLRYLLELEPEMSKARSLPVSDFSWPQKQNAPASPRRNFLHVRVYHTIRYCQVKFRNSSKKLFTLLFSVTLESSGRQTNPGKHSSITAIS